MKCQQTLRQPIVKRQYEYITMRALQRDRKKCGNDCIYHGWQPVGNAYFFAPDQIHANAEDQDGTGHRKVFHRQIGHERLDEPGKQCDGTFQHKHGYRGKDAALSEGACHDNDDDQIENRFGRKDTEIACHAVHRGADNRHGTDTDCERCGQKGINKRFVLRVPGFALEPFAEALKPCFNIQDFSCQCTEHQTEDKKHGSAACQSSVFYFQHSFHRTCNTDEQNADAAGCRERFLMSFSQKIAAEMSDNTADYNGSCIDDCTESDHF